jgi:hypothetical protein
LACERGGNRSGNAAGSGVSPHAAIHASAAAAIIVLKPVFARDSCNVRCRGLSENETLLPK